MENHEIPDARKQVDQIFDKMNTKISTLLPKNNLSEPEQEKMVGLLNEFNEEIRNQFLKEWHMVLAQDKIIMKLEFYLEVFGHEIEPIRTKILEEEDIAKLLKIARS